MLVSFISCVLCAYLALCTRGASASDIQCDVGLEPFGSSCWCSPGYYSLTGVARCSACDQNATNTAMGSSACQCIASYYSLNGNSPCAACPSHSDTFGPDPGMTYKNFFRNSISYKTTAYPGKDSCLCDIGSYGVGGKVPCVQCPDGSSTWVNLGVEFSPYYNGYPFFFTYDLVPTGVRCVCGYGYFSLYAGMPTDYFPCTKCPGWTTTSTVKSQSCDICIVGAYRESANSECLPCPTGTTTVYADPVGVASCSKCAVGYYSPRGAGPCTACPDGYSTAGIGQSVCLPLEAVSPTRTPTSTPTSPSAKPTTIKTHPPSSVSPSVALTTAPSSPSAAPTTAVPLIRATSRPSRSSTSRPTQPARHCAIGFHSSTGRGPHCSPCPEGTTNYHTGMQACYQCADGFHGTGGMRPCRPCPEGYSTFDAVGHSACVPCTGNEKGCKKKHKHAHYHLRQE